MRQLDHALLVTEGIARHAQRIEQQFAAVVIERVSDDAAWRANDNIAAIVDDGGSGADEAGGVVDGCWRGVVSTVARAVVCVVRCWIGGAVWCTASCCWRRTGIAVRCCHRRFDTAALLVTEMRRLHLQRTQSALGDASFAVIKPTAGAADGYPFCRQIAARVIDVALQGQCHCVLTLQAAAVAQTVCLYLQAIWCADCAGVFQTACAGDGNFADTSTDLAGIAHAYAGFGADQHNFVGVHAA